jgi:hypothetical protein
MIASARTVGVSSVSEMERLAARVAELSSKADFWNNGVLIFLVVTALAAAGIVVCQRLAFVRTRQASEAQGKVDLAKEAQLKLDLKDKDGKIAELQKDASDAKTAQQRVETGLEKQKERTASAEKSASDSALALAKFRQPRSLSPEQQDALVSATKPFGGQNFAFAVFPDPEPLALLRNLDVLLKSAGWKRVPSQIERTGGVLVEAAGESAATIFDSGIDAYIAPEDTESVTAQRALCSVLNASDIHCETHRTPQLAGKTPRAITISVGKKP